MRPSRSLLLLPLLVMSALLAPSVSSAAVTFGEPFTLNPGTTTVGAQVVQIRNSDGTEFTGSPITGVMTSVTVLSGGPAGTVTLLFARPTSPLGEPFSFRKFAPDLPVALTADETPAGHLTEVPLRISVFPGDRVGTSISPATGTGLRLAQTFASAPAETCAYRFVSQAWPLGAELSLTTASCNKNIPAIRATVEPDADFDGYGDETQDLCPALAEVQSACTSQLQLVADAPGKPKLGPIATRSFKLSNIGGGVASNVDFAVRSSKAVRQLKIVGGCTPKKFGRRCRIASIAPGVTVTIKVRVKAKALTKKTKLTASADGARASTTVRFRRSP